MATMRYFHPNISGHEAEELLKKAKIDGRFLVRPSGQSPGNLALSVQNVNNDVIHIRIRKENGYYDLYGGEKFKTLAELIQFYIENPGELKAKTGTFINLSKLLPYKGVPSNKWFHGGITEREAEFLLMTKAPSGSYLVQFSFHSPGNYVLSIRIGDEVVHVLIVHEKMRYGIVGSAQFESIAGFIDYYRQHPLVETSGRVIELKYPLNNSFILPQLIKEQGQELEKPVNQTGKSGFADELEKLNSIDMSNHFSTIEADKPENFSKNRFKDIIPFDHTRVSLGRDASVPGSTYINASWINGEIPGSEFSYIAAQSHLPGTLHDFWYMAWQEKCLIIVMLDDEKNDTSSEERYWPTPEDPGFYGPIQVVSLEEASFPNYILRHFLVCHEYEDEEDEQHTFQFQFLGWPNTTQPDQVNHLYTFCNDVKKKLTELQDSNAQPGPLLVHCDAGIGRTGVFILNDILRNVIDRQKIEQEIDIRRSIELINEQRPRMLQTEDQYELLFHLLACHTE